VTRSPLAAWRRLFAIGGTPAASHAALSRAPSSEGLLDPLARTRIVDDARLAALTRPLDLGGLLGRVAATAVAVEPPPADAAPDGMVQPARSAGSRSASSDATSRALPPLPSAAGVQRRDRHARQTGAFGDRPSPARRRAPIGPAAPAGRTRLGAALSPGAERCPAGSPAIADAPPPHGDEHSRKLSPQALAGAQARVVLDAPMANVERLLAVRPQGAPGSTRAPASPFAPLADASGPRSRDLARLLSDAVARARPALAAGEGNASSRAVVVGGAGRAPAPRTTVAGSRTNGVLARENGSGDAENETGRATPGSEMDRAGGFRGLAARTLESPRESRRVETRRLQAEPRTPADLSRDTLDAAVAESLARVLDREARRQGIDLAEARV